MLEYVLTDEGSEIIREDLCNRLKAGQVGIVPTETVYGLVCLASNEDGQRRIADMKKRDNRRSMQFLVSDLESCEWLDVEVNDTMRKLVENERAGHPMGARLGLRLVSAAGYSIDPTASWASSGRD